jgi:hypothetical protein
MALSDRELIAQAVLNNTARTAVGMAQLPLNLPVVIAAEVAVR